MVSAAAPSYGKRTTPTVRGFRISACGVIDAAGRWVEDLFGGDELRVNVVRSSVVGGRTIDTPSYVSMAKLLESI